MEAEPRFAAMALAPAKKRGGWSLAKHALNMTLLDYSWSENSFFFFALASALTKKQGEWSLVKHALNMTLLDYSWSEISIFFLTRGSINRCIAILPPSQNKCRYSFRMGQTFLSLTWFIEIISNIWSLNKFIIKIDSKIYLMILIINIMYYKYNIFYIFN
jgi:hypothetical protein